jgi:sensor histidine kinase regulating citrate/malate metabolism
MLLIPFFLLETREIKKIILYPFIAIGSSVIGVCFSFLLATILKVPEHIIVVGNWYTILCQSLQSIVLIILAVYIKIYNKDSYQVNLDWKQYVLFYVVAISLFFMLAPIQRLTQKYEKDPFINLSGLFVSVACIVLVFITIWQGVVVTREIRLKEQNKKNKEYIILQKEYYNKLLNQDEKLRSFRHDIKAHLLVIKAHCHNRSYEELETYLNCVDRESEIFQMDSYTGNNSVDAVFRQYFLTAKKKEIKLEIKGNLFENIRPSNYDLCTILSNLTDNAIEACEKIEDILERKINITIGCFNDQVFISVKNTFVAEIVKKNNHFITTKKDYKNHGIGSVNVENTVKKYHGVLEYKFEDGWFTAEVTI